MGMIPNEKPRKGMGMKEGKGRKVRSDKKRDVKPTISTFVKESLYYYAYLVGLPVKDAAYLLIKKGLRDDVVLQQFRHLFISNFHIENRLYIANREDGPVKVNYRGTNGKVTIKFTNETYEELRKLAFAIGLTPTTTAALMLRKTLFTPEFMEEHIKQFRKIHDSFRMGEIERFVMSLPKTIPKENNSSLKSKIPILRGK